MKYSLLVFLFVIATMRGYGQSCTLSVSISSSDPAICSGSSVVLTANTSGGTAPFTYLWNTGETTQSISVNKAGTYTVTVSDKTPGCSPVKKSITIASNPVPDPPTASAALVCPNTPAVLTATAPGGLYQWYDAQTGGNFLASGATFTTPPVTKNINYYVQTTLNGCTSQRTFVAVRLIANPTGKGATVCANNVATLTASGGDTYSWYASSTGGTVLGTGPAFVTPILTTTTTYYVQATTNGCLSSFVPVVATVTPPPQQPTASDVTICSGSSANLHASAPAGVFDWFTTPTGGTSIISSPDYTTPALTTTTAYYVQTSLNGCTSQRTKVIVTVNPLPAAPVVPGVTICSGSAATLSAQVVPGNTYLWYSAPSGGVLLATGNTFTTPVLTAPATYYVLATNGGCSSSTRTAVTVSVNQVPPSPSANGTVTCSGNTVILTATAPGGTYQWYDAATGGNLLFTGASYITPPLSTTTNYYVQTTLGGCTSARTTVTVIVGTSPAPPAASGATVCAGSSASLTASGLAGSSYQWYDAATGGNFLASGQVFTTPALSSTTTYYVQQIASSNGCTSTRTAVTVTVNPIPAPPTASGTTVCQGSAATLTATATGGTISWYDAATGGNLLGTGSTFTTPVLATTTTFYAEHDSGTCSSSRTAVMVNITPVPNPEFQYPSGTFCTSAANPTPVINNPSGGTFSASPAGLVFVSTTTGQINAGASTPGNYVISFSSNGTCPTVTSASVAIVTTPDAHFSYSGPYCQSGTNPLPVFPSGSSAGVFSASPGGLVFVNTSTGEIDLSASTAGTYTVTNTISASGACSASTFSTTVVIDPVVYVNAGSDQTVPSGTPVTLAGSISGGTSSGTWSGGAGSFSNPNALNAVYTPGPGEASATLTLTSDDPVGPCGPKSATVTITFSPIPPAPTASGASVCMGSTAILSATAPGGTYEWYDAATGGNLLQTGAVYTTPALTATTTYYVQTTVGGATSTRTAVTVTVNSIPPAPVVSPDTICSGSAATLTASGSVGVYQWYDAPTGGHLLSASNPYVTTFLTASTTYYVQGTLNGCTSPRTQVNVTVNPVPSVTSPGAGVVCSGTPLNYTITSDVPGATFVWSRAAVTNISNPAVTNQTSSSITDTLLNTGNTAVDVTYVITPMANGCSGTPFNYVVTVNPLPVVTSSAADSICNATAVNYTIKFSTGGTGFSWSRAAVTGISNAAVSGQRAGTIKEVLFNTTNAPINVTYVFNYSLSGCGGTFDYVVTVEPGINITSAKSGTACSGVAQNYAITADVPGATFMWSRAAVPNISNPSVTNQTSSVIDETLINTASGSVRVNYIITPLAYGCQDTSFTYSVLVYPQPSTPSANANSPVCIGSTIHLQTPVVPNASYLWTGPNGFTSTDQNPDISNVTLANSGVYKLYVIVNNCSSQPDSVNVQVDDLPLANAGPDTTVCINSTSVQLAGSVTGGTTTGVWTTSGTGTFSPASNILTGQYIPSAQDKTNGSVTLTLASTSKDDCTISTSKMKITFYQPVITSGKTDSVCTGNPLNYTITSNSPTATFTWSRATVAGISNPAVTNQTTSTITETLVNTTANPVKVAYIITPIDNGCPGPSFTYTVTVNPQPATPTISSNSPVCVGTGIQLNTPVTADGYVWTGPNGFSSNLQNPAIANVTAADAGTYSLYIVDKGCQSAVASVNVVVDQPPVASAGPNQIVCETTTSVTLAGSVTGGTTSGIWTSAGTGTFSPSDTLLNAQYNPSAQDVAAGSVTLTLSSASKDNCAISTSSMTISFQAQPAVDAGNDTSVCSQTVGVKLNGKLLIAAQGTWATSGTGTFSPSVNQPDATYVPSAADIAGGSVTLTLSVNNAGVCFVASDQMKITFVPPPTVNAGGTRYVLHGRTITLYPTVSDNNVTYQWSPDIGISSTTVKNPVVTGDVDRTYTLTVTDSRGCVSSDQTYIKVSPEVTIPNTFTPNGDGVNDIWNIQGLLAYPDAVVDIFDRNGQKVYHSVGYAKPWDGTYNGKQVPFGVYYYVIDTNLDGMVLSGYVTIIR